MQRRLYDPDINEMRERLDQSLWHTHCGYSEEEWTFAREQAIYWFASDWHGGQATSLYHALCISDYKPGRLENRPADGMPRELYNLLVKEYFPE